MGFGVGASLASYGANKARSASLAAFGEDEQSQAMQELGAAAEGEERREAANTELASKEKAGKQQFGGMLGGIAGTAAGTAMGKSIGGTLGNAVMPGLGGIVGGLIGGLVFDKLF